MTRITGIVPTNGDIFTQQALDGLVGQQAPLLRGNDHTSPIGRATVVAAAQEGEALVLTLDLIPLHRSVEFAEALGFSIPDGATSVEMDVPLSLGYTLPAAEPLPDGHRQFLDVRARTFGPPSMPFTREDLNKQEEGEA